MYFEIRELSVKNLQINLENGKIEGLKSTYYHGKAFRVLRNGFWGYHVGYEDDKKGLEIAMKNAIGRGDVDVVEGYFKGEVKFKEKVKLEDIDIDEKVSLLKDLDRSLLMDGIVSRKLVYVESLLNLKIKNSESEARCYIPRCGIIIQAFAKGKTLQFYSERFMKVGGFEVLSNVLENSERVAKIAVKLSNAKSPPSGKMNVIMDPRLTGVFIHEAFGHAVEADHVMQNASVAVNLIGKRVGDESLNVYDDPTIQEFGYFPFDDEGHPANKKVIIENGILKNYLHSRETAKKLGGKAGNARADLLDFPIVRMSNTFIAPGDYDVEELFEIAKNGVYLLGSRGGETNPATGYFQFNTQYGYIIERGEIKEMIRDVSLSGNTLEILREIKIGNDLSFEPGFCGKTGQLVPVSDGGPTTLVKAFVGGS